MDRINDGGPVFPVLVKVGEVAKSEGGMTLRDWFAGQAPEVPDWFVYPGYPVYPTASSVNEYGTPSCADGVLDAHRDAARLWNFSREAAWRYAYADAMLAERAKGGDRG